MGKHQISSILTKALPLAIFSLSMLGFPTAVRAEEWERFFARLDNDKLVVGFDGSATLQSGAEGLWFKSDGRYAKTATGVATVGGFDTYCNETPQSCGRYESSGDRYTLYSTSNPNEVRDTFIYSNADRSEPKISNENLTYFLVPPIPSDFNFRFDANLRSINNQIYGSIYSFDKSGRISIENPSSSEVKTGTYDIEDYTITFNYDNGETETKPFYFIGTKALIDGRWHAPAK